MKKSFQKEIKKASKKMSTEIAKKNKQMILQLRRTFTRRFLPKRGKCKTVSQNSGNVYYHDESNEACMIHVFKESGKIQKISPEKWPNEAHKKFAIMYGEQDEDGFGVDKPFIRTYAQSSKEQTLETAKKSKYCLNYTLAEDKIIIDYMTQSHKEEKDGILREINLAKKSRIIAEKMVGRKPHNIVDRWKRELKNKVVENALKKNLRELEKERLNHKNEIEQLKRELEKERLNHKNEIEQLKRKIEKYNRPGTQTWPNGDKYVGAYKDGNRHGEGTKTYANGCKYVGAWKDGKKHGEGTETFADGRKYVGAFQDDKMHGQGIFTWACGSKYVGEWKDGKMHGQGRYTWASGDKYVGAYKDGKKHGQGTFTHTNGSKYVGEWKDGKMHGAEERKKVELKKFKFSRIEKMTQELEMYKKQLIERRTETQAAEEEAKKAAEEAAEKEAIEENGFDSSDEESDMDDDAFVFNPFEYNGIKYHLEDMELYHFDLKKQELEEFGTLNDDGTVTVL